MHSKFPHFLLRVLFLSTRVLCIGSGLSLLAGCATLGQSQNVSAALACDFPPNDVLEAIVPIKSGSTGNASGVVVAKNRILTVAHGVNPREDIFIIVNGKKRPATVEHINVQSDLALLATDTSGLTAVPMSSGLPSQDEMTWAVGYPLARDQKISVGYYQRPYNGRLYTSNHVNSGVSGGALLRCSQGYYSLTGVVHGYVALMSDSSIVNLGDSTSVRPDVIADFIMTAESLGVAMTSHASSTVNRRAFSQNILGVVKTLSAD